MYRKNVKYGNDELKCGENMDRCRIFLVRHTQTVGNVEKRLTGRQDYEVTEKGKKYINLMTEALKDIKFDAVYSSSAGRAKKTVQPLAEIDGISIIEKADLAEMYFGKYDGWKWEDVNKVEPQIKQTQIEINEIKGITGQETTQEVANRMYRCIYNIAKENKGKTVLIASHGVAIEAFLRKIDGKEFNVERQKYCQLNTAINELYFEKEKFHEVNIASIEHLKNEV